MSESGGAPVSECEQIGHDLDAPPGFERLRCGRCGKLNPLGYKCRWVAIKCHEAPFPECQFGKGCRDGRVTQ